MEKSYKAASSVGAIALILSGSVMASAPAFDGWTVTNGTINGGSCPTGYECSGDLTDVGFFQRTMRDTVSDITYFQTIITENNAAASNSTELDNLVFSDESFVRTGNVNGIADKQRISDVKANTLPATGSTTFKAATTLNSGWAGDYLKITQHLDDTSDNFQTDFIFAQKGNADLNSVTAKGMKITAYVPLQGAVGTDRQDFALINMSGDYTNHAPINSATIPNVGTMTWANDDTAGSNAGQIGDNIQAIWIGQDLTNIVGQLFGFTSFENKTTGSEQLISGWSLSSMDVGGWDEVVWDRTPSTGNPGDSRNTQNVTDPFIPFP